MQPKTITKSFQGVSYLFPRSIRALEKVLNDLDITYTLTGKDDDSIKQVLTITIEHECDDNKLFSLGMLVMQTILFNR